MVFIKENWIVCLIAFFAICIAVLTLFKGIKDSNNKKIKNTELENFRKLELENHKKTNVIDDKANYIKKQNEKIEKLINENKGLYREIVDLQKQNYKSVIYSLEAPKVLVKFIDIDYNSISVEVENIGINHLSMFLPMAKIGIKQSSESKKEYLFRNKLLKFNAFQNEKELGYDSSVQYLFPNNQKRIIKLQIFDNDDILTLLSEFGYKTSISIGVNLNFIANPSNTINSIYSTDREKSHPYFHLTFDCYLNDEGIINVTNVEGIPFLPFFKKTPKGLFIEKESK